MVLYAHVYSPAGCGSDSPARAVLYHTVTVTSTQTAALLSVIESSPYLANLVQSVTIIGGLNAHARNGGPWLLVFILPNLRSLRIGLRTVAPPFFDEHPWLALDALGPPIRTMQLIGYHSTIQHLFLSGVTLNSGWGFLLLIASLSHLRSLALCRITLGGIWSESDGERLGTSLVHRRQPYIVNASLELDAATYVRAFLKRLFITLSTSTALRLFVGP